MAKHPATRKSMELMRAEGYTVAITEHWQARPHAVSGPPGVRQDLFGFCDLLGIKAGATLAVQATSYGSLSAHYTKMCGVPEVVTAIRAGWIVELHGWHQDRPRGKWYLKRRQRVELPEPSPSGHDQPPLVRVSVPSSEFPSSSLSTSPG